MFTSLYIARGLDELQLQTDALLQFELLCIDADVSPSGHFEP